MSDSDTPLAPGDVVTLNSGGPPMTVVKVPAAPAEPGAELVLCTWMGKDDEAVHEHSFPASALSASTAGHGHKKK